MTHKKNDVDFRILMRRSCARMMWHFISNAYYRKRVQQIQIDYLASYSIRHFLRPISIYTNLKTAQIEDLHIRLSNKINV